MEICDRIIPKESMINSNWFSFHSLHNLYEHRKRAFAVYVIEICEKKTETMATEHRFDEIRNTEWKIWLKKTGNEYNYRKCERSICDRCNSGLWLCRLMTSMTFSSDFGPSWRKTLGNIANEFPNVENNNSEENYFEAMETLTSSTWHHLRPIRIIFIRQKWRTIILWLADCEPI